MSIKNNYELTQKRIREKIQDPLQSRSREDRQIEMIAVTKGRNLETVEILYQLGQRDFGENYFQELREKALEMKRRGYSDVRWHFLGHLQTNKVKALMPLIHSVHTVDSLRLLQEILKHHACFVRVPLPIFLEINLDQEQSKSGILPNDAASFVNDNRELFQTDWIRLEGLMCIPNPEEDPRQKFIELRKLESTLRPLSRGKLSMGMSSDFETAIEEGATHIRLGQVLFKELTP